MTIFRLDLFLQTSLLSSVTTGENPDDKGVLGMTKVHFIQKPHH